MLRVTCLGGAGSVTGSNYLIESPGGKKILVDCGLFQGGRDIEGRNWLPWTFNPKDIDTLILTHAHIDHSGRVPKLVKDGFQGQIIASPPTAELCEIMLLDAAHIQEMDAEWQTRKNKRQAKGPIAPLYTRSDAEASLRLFVSLESDRVMELEPGVRVRLRNAGHILGSSILELWVKEGDETIKIVFSGDLGRKDQLILRNPQEIFDADYLFLESTYGNRRHRSFEDSKRELLEAIDYSVSKNEKIIIPAFAVERTQEILYILGEFSREGRLPEIPVYLDSPLAIKATEIFRRNKLYYDDETRAIVDRGYDPFHMPNLRLTESTRDSVSINETPGSAIVIAGNGMCTAGRIRHHLKHNLWRDGASLVIVGFQAQGTTGRKIVDGAKQVKIFGENVAVRAKVFTIGGFSAHADQEDLLQWLANFESGPRVFLVHGELAVCETLAEKIRERFDLSIHIPKWKERLILRPRGVEIEKPEAAETGPEPRVILANLLVDLEKELRALKKRIATKEGAEKIGTEEAERLRYVQEEIQSLLS